MTFDILPARTEDIIEICRIHMNAFQDYFLSHFGEEFLNMYYRNYLSSSQNILLVAKSNKKIVGFVAGTLDKNLLHQVLFRNNFIPIAIITAKRILTNRRFRNEIISKSHMLVSAIKVKLFRNHLKSINGNDNFPIRNEEVKLLSIAVLDDFKGRGASLSLMKEFDNNLKIKGASACTLSVRSDNLRGIGFYKKSGWHIINENNRLITFKKT